METKQFQDMCAEAVKKIDVKYGINRDMQLSFTQLIEEVGELAKEINKPKLRKKEIDRENLDGEFADVLLQLSVLAKMLDVDFEKAVGSKMEVLRERHGI